MSLEIALEIMSSFAIALFLFDKGFELRSFFN